jgi:hypothetical protein
VAVAHEVEADVKSAARTELLVTHVRLEPPARDGVGEHVPGQEQVRVSVGQQYVGHIAGVVLVVRALHGDDAAEAVPFR